MEGAEFSELVGLMYDAALDAAVRSRWPAVVVSLRSAFAHMKTRTTSE